MNIDTSEKILADNNDVFADIFNVLLFDGRKVINEHGLENSKDRSQYKADGKLREQERDVSKFYNKQEMRIAFLGVEHQNRRDSYMPARVISYDASNYRAQILNRRQRIKEKAEDRKNVRRRREPKKLYPVITLVLYFGNNHWKQGRNLYDILDIPEDFMPYVNDYRINLVEVAFLDPETVAKFQSDFRIVADYFVQKRLTDDYVGSEIDITHVDETLKLLGVLAKDDRFPEEIDAMKEEKKMKGKVNMCEVLDKIEGRGFEKGKQEGIRWGIEQERVHTEEERKKTEEEKRKAEEQRKRAEEAEKRAGKAESRADELQKEVERLQKLLEKSE